MNASSNASESNSTARTSSSAAASSPKALSESSFLQKQAQDAKQAMARSAQLLQENLKRSFDPSAVTRSHPILALVGAAAGGFALAATVGRHREKPAEAPSRPRQAAAAPAGRSGAKLSRLALRLALRAARPIIIGSITGALSGKAAANTSSNGHGDSEAASESNLDAGPEAI